MAARKKMWMVLINHDMIRDNNRGVQTLNAIVETYSTVQKVMKENQECTRGDYSAVTSSTVKTMLDQLEPLLVFNGVFRN